MKVSKDPWVTKTLKGWDVWPLKQQGRNISRIFEEDNGLRKWMSMFLKANTFRNFFPFEIKCFLDILFTLFKSIHLMSIFFLFIFFSNTHDLLKLRFRNIFLRMTRDNSCSVSSELFSIVQYPLNYSILVQYPLNYSIFRCLLSISIHWFRHPSSHSSQHLSTIIYPCIYFVPNSNHCEAFRNGKKYTS